ncbi:BPTD_3102 family carboxylase-like protein [Bordetella holmesii]|uniref:Carbamoyl-phosphate synthase L chain, ATP-binding domain protein n=2 Tax=Bordetella holmesii TaxID=35814 RepID=A0A158M6R4_9BORD|nr:hypothetical protein [Bordetella holmesii]AHV94457.1 carbamoyl-phosphate synthase L chain, ATP binding domain protein [Bordetella holmesii ATCC 51541]AIT25154.1 carbamoyl-phosphate synthase L chain, ATP binding domain protein [Bordetella holmesii 44057]EWM48258.1 carbamoyl-phosphate synthase L chain, ATP binding domain protein [Bordetella holmesii 41130]EWM49843.1 carbamoyl-phosphate synthase L chain, ATP binding domain protein [Bordetella holmesii 35009]AMD44389.1 hypothetical protein H558
MGAKVSFVTPSAGVVDKRRLPPGGPVGGAERRLDIHVLGQEDGHVETGRAWERSVWRDQRVLIAECPAPRLSARMEATLRDVASCIAVDRGWLGLGTAVFALDDQSGQFRLIEATLQGRRGKAALMEPMAAHALEVGIGACAASGRPGTSLLVWGSTRGEALRRAYQAIGDMPGLAVPERAFLLNRIASPAFCSGLTGMRLARIADWSDHRAAS